MLTLVILTLLPSACGGSDTGVSSAPPPVTVPAQVVETRHLVDSPATRTGKYDAIALVEDGGPTPGASISRLAGAGEIRILTGQAATTPGTITYALEFSNPMLPGGRTNLTALMPPREIDSPLGRFSLRFGEELTAKNGQLEVNSSYLMGQSEVKTEEAGLDRRFGSQLLYGTGLSYVSLGQWNWWIDDAANGNHLEYHSIYFVHGDRTPASGLPISGSATYTGKSFGQSTDVVDRGSSYGAQIDVSLTAHFDSRAIDALLDRKASTSGDAIGGSTSVAAISMTGSGKIAATGAFAVPLAGNFGTTQVTGSLDGAFFGPAAEQVGGVFSAGAGPGQTLVRDAFALTRAGP